MTVDMRSSILTYCTVFLVAECSSFAIVYGLKTPSPSVPSRTTPSRQATKGAAILAIRMGAADCLTATSVTASSNCAQVAANPATDPITYALACAHQLYTTISAVSRTTASDGESIALSTTSHDTLGTVPSSYSSDDDHDGGSDNKIIDSSGRSTSNNIDRSLSRRPT
jgi:hypothetical protein